MERQYLFIFKINTKINSVDDVVSDDFGAMEVFIVQEINDERGHLLIVDSDKKIAQEELYSVFKKHKIDVSLLKSTGLNYG
jgi:hypothetical protein